MILQFLWYDLASNQTQLYQSQDTLPLNHIFHHLIWLARLPEGQLHTMVSPCCVWETHSSPVTQEADYLFTFPDHEGTHSHSIRGRRRRLSPKARSSVSFLLSLNASAASKTRVFLCSPSLPSPLVGVLKVVSWTLCHIYNAWLQVGDVFILACWINTVGWFSAGDGGAGIWDVEGCGSPAEQPLSAAASPAAEVKPGNQCLREPWIFFAFTTHEMLFHQGRSCIERQRERAHLRHTSRCAREKKTKNLCLLSKLWFFFLLFSIRLHSTRTSSSTSRSTQWHFGLKRNQISQVLCRCERS